MMAVTDMLAAEPRLAWTPSRQPAPARPPAGSAARPRRGRSRPAPGRPGRSHLLAEELGHVVGQVPAVVGQRLEHRGDLVVHQPLEAGRERRPAGRRVDGLDLLHRLGLQAGVHAAPEVVVGLHLEALEAVEEALAPLRAPPPFSRSMRSRARGNCSLLRLAASGSVRSSCCTRSSSARSRWRRLPRPGPACRRTPPAPGGGLVEVVEQRHDAALVVEAPSLRARPRSYRREDTGSTGTDRPARRRC